MSEQPYYETMYILRPDIPEDEVEAHLEKYSEILSKAGVEILDNQMRGKRRLAYSIGKHKEGIYVQLSHKGDGKQVAVLEKAMRLSEDVIRYLTVKQDGPPPVRRSNKNNDKKDKAEETGKDKKADEAGKDKKTEETGKDKKTEQTGKDKKADEAGKDKKTDEVKNEELNNQDDKKVANSEEKAKE